MKRLLLSSLFALSVVNWSVLPAAESASPPSATGKAAAKPIVAGDYSGKWKSKGDAGGDLRIKLKQDGEAAWVAEATFTFEGSEVPTKTKSIKVEGSKLELTISWEIQGTAAQSKLTGECTGDVLEGKYENSSSEGAAQGTWNVTRV